MHKKFTEKGIIDLQKKLMDWGEMNMKVYPWRYANDPYKILVSEFMLHRTNAKQVEPVFNKYMTSFPKLGDVREADRENIKNIMKPLGLKWRTDGMINALLELQTRYGHVPIKVDKLTEIRGIGQYIAGATVCFSTNNPLVLIDTNIVRVVGRLHGLNLSGEARRRKEVEEAIRSLVDRIRPRDFYYIMIDFAHQVCISKKPDCEICPLASLPCAFSTKSIIDK